MATTNDRDAGINTSAARILEISGDDGLISAQVTIINDAVTAIDARAAALYTPLNIT